MGIRTPTASKRRAGIVAVDVPDIDSLIERLLVDDFEAGAELGRLRIDVHAYNSEGEIDRLLEALKTRL